MNATVSETLPPSVMTMRTVSGDIISTREKSSGADMMGICISPTKTSGLRSSTASIASAAVDTSLYSNALSRLSSIALMRDAFTSSGSTNNTKLIPALHLAPHQPWRCYHHTKLRGG